MMGAERKSMVMSDKQKETTAYHESGHAVVAKLLPGTDPVHKVTIIPRGRALGLTMQLPTEDRFNYERNEILNNIAILMGGRVAEEIFLNQMTTGAGNDIQRATELARRMVTQWGMSNIGPMVIGEKEEELFLGREISKHSNVSEETARTVDEEVQRIIREQYQRARHLVETNRDKVEIMTRALLKFETLDADQVNDIMAGREVRAKIVVDNGPGSGTGTPAPVIPSGGEGSDKEPSLKPGSNPV